MRYLFVLAASLSTACATIDAPSPDYRFDNGQWFNGTSFEPRTGYIVDGALSFSNELRESASVIDLAGGFVVPPFCEGHNHNFGGSAEGVEERVQAYLTDGVFYAMMPGSFEFYRTQIQDKLNTPDSVDVAFANNGLTGSGGHPRGLRESLMKRYGLYSEFTEETLPDKGYFEADTLTELQEKWSLIRAENTDFIKVMLYYSEDYDIRKDDPEYYGRRGLDPELLPELIRLAHDADLRVAVHVESDADLQTAIRAGADIIAHLPSSNDINVVSDETIAMVKQAGTALVTTLSLSKRRQRRAPDQYAVVLDVQRDNLTRLNAAGIPLVVGSDNVRDTSKGEVAHLSELGIFDNQTLLTMWTENCATMVFPDRKIGRLNEGYEASFLVLADDPLANFENTGQIQLRVKDGKLLTLAD